MAVCLSVSALFQIPGYALPLNPMTAGIDSSRPPRWMKVSVKDSVLEYFQTSTYSSTQKHTLSSTFS